MGPVRPKSRSQERTRRNGVVGPAKTNIEAAPFVLNDDILFTYVLSPEGQGLLPRGCIKPKALERMRATPVGGSFVYGRAKKTFRKIDPAPYVGKEYIHVWERFVPKKFFYEA
jgi:hypothetical protein